MDLQLDQTKEITYVDNLYITSVAVSHILPIDYWAKEISWFPNERVGEFVRRSTTIHRIFEWISVPLFYIKTISESRLLSSNAPHHLLNLLQKVCYKGGLIV